MAISLIIGGKAAALKKEASFEYVSENRAFTDADDYTLDIELPLADCPQNIAIFGMLTRKDVDAEEIFFDAVLQDNTFFKRGAIVITGITQESVKVQFLEKRSYQNFFPHFDETYIDELDLGEWPLLVQDNLGSGNNTPTTTGEVSGNPVTPAEIWARWQDYTALPWVNNYSGNIQNCAKWDVAQSKYVWKTQPDNNDDGDYSRNLSFQPNLLWLTKKICDALDYDYDFTAWEDSDYKYLLVVNTIPYTWQNRKWAAALPHWTINEFFLELEKLLLMEFDIDHARALVTCTATSDNVANAGTVQIDKVIDDFSVEVDSKDEDRNDNYKPMQNQGYANAGHRLSPIYDAQWYIDQKTKLDGTVDCNTWATLAALISSTLKQDAVNDEGGGRRQLNSYPGTKWGLHYAEDVDTYFVLEVMKRVKYRDGQLVEAYNWGNVCRLVPINRFGPLILDKENEENIEEMNIVPAWLDETEERQGNIIFLETGETSDDEYYSNEIHVGNRPGAEVVEPETVIQFGAFPRIENGETEKANAHYDKLFVAYWWGDYTNFNKRLPHPWTDTFDMYYSYLSSSTLTSNTELHVTWVAEYSGQQLSLRINNRAYGQGTERTSFTEVDLKKKYNFSFLADEIPNVRSMFYIEGKKYLCEKITATFSENGMSRLMKGVFYKVI